MTCQHFIVLSFPAQGHLNPNLQFSKRLLRKGVRVTFMTSEYARLSQNADAQLPKGLSLLEYHDGYDGHFTNDTNQAKKKMARMIERSTEAIRRVVSSAADDGCRVTCVTYSLLQPWAAAVARELSIPSAFVWIQPATVFDLYYYYFHGYDGLMHDLELNQPESRNVPAGLDLPGLPFKFTMRDLPSFFTPNTPYIHALSLFKEHMAELDAESGSATVLVNTFDSLELEALTALSFSNIKLTAIGPLIPSVYLNGDDPSDTGSGGDLFQTTTSSYINWLDTKEDKSVIYISFGSISILSNDQMNEIATALLELNKPFLWIIRTEPENRIINNIEKLNQLGTIVPWCSQLQVLTHRSIACFFTHCGWNSTLESLVCGVPMIGFPQWTDQTTNAKLVEDYWKIGVRVSTNCNGLVEKNEIKRCLELVMDDVEMRLSALKWKKMAVEAVKEGGSSDRNLKDFVNAIGRG